MLILITNKRHNRIVKELQDDFNKTIERLANENTILLRGLENSRHEYKILLDENEKLRKELDERRTN